jgi:hypothetical protein
MLQMLNARFAVATVLVWALVSVAGEEPTILRETSSAAWPVPMFGFHGHAQCDADGNLYFRTSLAPSDIGLLEIAADGSKYHFYKVPGAGDADASYYQFGLFNVTPSGELRVLTYGSDHAVYVFLFHADFSDPSKTKLQLPAYVHVDSFAAFEKSGAILVTGFFTKAAEKELRGKTYTATFEASGKLRAVVGEHFGDVDLASVGKHLPEGGAALGEDGSSIFCVRMRLS